VQGILDLLERRLCASLADDGPPVVCVDDGQWADEPSLSLVRSRELLAHALDREPAGVV
jgi:hypothetical protein